MHPKYIVLDFESYYDFVYSLRKMTPVEYILDPRFECMGASVTEGDNGVPYWLDAGPLQNYLEGIRGKPIPILSHNALFDMCLLAWRFDFVPKLMIDTMGMARALVFAYIGRVSLDAVASYLGLGPKGKTILKVAGMHKADIKAAGLWQEYTEYACDDGILCRGIFKALRGEFPASEYAVMDMVLRAAVQPQFILDRHALARHANQIAVDKASLLARCGLTSPDDLMSNPKFAEALQALGVEPGLKTSLRTGKDAYAFAKTDEFMAELEEHEDPLVQSLVAARLGHKSTLEETRTARFISISNLTWPGKGQVAAMPIPLRYSGAHTHRFSGDWKLNLQNLPRGGELRDALTVPDGHVVVTCDASQIEARINPYLAGQEDLVEAFRRGEDIYSQFASEEVYHRPVDKKTDPAGRFVGKQSILGLGYQMGPPKFQSTIRVQSRSQLNQEMIIPIDEATMIVQAYRRRYHKIRDSWQTLQGLLPYLAGEDSKREYGPFVFRHQKIVGPNGLSLYYHELEQTPGERGPQWVFSYGKKPKYLYGGKLLENIVQFAARIHIMETAARVKKHFPQFNMALQVHDELLYVVPQEAAQELRLCLEHEMSQAPSWAPGIPLAAESGVGRSYGTAK